jgi:6-pyruvoyltetrahydropterin/6-carboxytetrahydropterin synthase
MYSIRKQFKFEASHQLNGAYSKACTDCIHGHSYIVEVFFKSKNLNKDGMVIDFGEISDILNGLIQTYDHALFIPESFGEEYINILKKYNSEKKLHICKTNPTAENMARWMYESIKLALDDIFKGAPELLHSVRVHETRTGWAEYSE